jgi:hypothetical protein
VCGSYRCETGLASVVVPASVQARGVTRLMTLSPPSSGALNWSEERKRGRLKPTLHVIVSHTSLLMEMSNVSSKLWFAVYFSMLTPLEFVNE